MATSGVRREKAALSTRVPSLSGQRSRWKQPQAFRRGQTATTNVSLSWFNINVFQLVDDRRGHVVNMTARHMG
jgi:hypothetical protein